MTTRIGPPVHRSIPATTGGAESVPTEAATSTTPTRAAPEAQDAGTHAFADWLQQLPLDTPQGQPPLAAAATQGAAGLQSLSPPKLRLKALDPLLAVSEQIATAGPGLLAHRDAVIVDRDGIEHAAPRVVDLATGRAPTLPLPAPPAWLTQNAVGIATSGVSLCFAGPEGAKSKFVTMPGVALQSVMLDDNTALVRTRSGVVLVANKDGNATIQSRIALPQDADADADVGTHFHQPLIATNLLGGGFLWAGMLIQAENGQLSTKPSGLPANLRIKAGAFDDENHFFCIGRWENGAPQIARYVEDPVAKQLRRDWDIRDFAAEHLVVLDDGIAVAAAGKRLLVMTPDGDTRWNETYFVGRNRIQSLGDVRGETLVINAPKDRGAFIGDVVGARFRNGQLIPTFWKHTSVDGLEAVPTKTGVQMVAPGKDMETFAWRVSPVPLTNKELTTLPDGDPRQRDLLFPFTPEV